jgi:hypothetical protein
LFVGVILLTTGETEMNANSTNTDSTKVVLTNYVGVTDVRQVSHALNLCKLVEGSDYKMHIGVMTNFDTMKNGIPPEKYQKVWRPKNELAISFVNHPSAFNVIHYADYSKEGRTTAKTLQEVCEHGGQYCHGIQLDMIWPAPEIILDTKKVHPNMKVILQVGRNAMSDMFKEEMDADSLFRLSDRLNKEYFRAVDYVLIDFSGGEGIILDTHKMLLILGHLHKHAPGFSYVIAGGLHAGNLNLVNDILRYFPISWDAQGRLRLSRLSTDPLDIDLATNYVRQSAGLAKAHRRL